MSAKENFLRNLATEIEVEVKSKFDMDELRFLAKEAGYEQRSTGQLTGDIFLNMVVFNSRNILTQSYNDMAGDISETYGFKISKQSVCDRFTKYAVEFLKKALARVLSSQITDNQILKDFNPFKRVIIKDSTSFQLDETLKEFYKGCGGSATGAGMRIQFEYDLLSGTINDLSVNAFNDQDGTDSKETIVLVKEEDLVIRDLAYMGMDVLKAIIKKLAYFLCRPQQKVTIHEVEEDTSTGEKKYIKINFQKLRRMMRKKKLSVLEKKVVLKSELDFEIRLIINTLPLKIVKKRLEKARKEARKKNRSGKLSPEYIARAHFNLILTNATKEQIKPQKAYDLYSIRWQIELIFKVWKSLCDIEKVNKKVKRERLDCYIYGKLIFIVLGWQFFWQFCKNMYEVEHVLLSAYKFFKTWIDKIKELSEVLVFGTVSVLSFTRKLYNRSRWYHKLEIKKGKNNYISYLLNLLIK